MEKKNRLFWWAISLTALWFLLVLLGPLFAPNDPYATNPAVLRSPPSKVYPFGTDGYGRCVLSRILWGGRTSVCAAVGLVAATFLFGTVLGILSGWYGGILDELLMRLGDILLAFPQMVVAIAVAGILGGGLWSALAALGFTAWPQYARLARSRVIALKGEPFLQAAQLSGEGDFRILVVHVVPNCLGPLAVSAAVQLGNAMMGLSGLSFLGLGVQIPQAEWGNMVSEAFPYLQLAPWAVLAPGGAIVVTVALFHLLGDAARDALGR